MPTTPSTVHVPGTLPANATTIGFDWSNKATGPNGNGNIIASYQETLQIIDQCRAVAKDEVQAVEDGVSLLAAVTARNLTSLTNLPPFPLPGTNAGLSLLTVDQFLVMWQASLAWMSSPQTVTMTIAVPNPTDGTYALNADGSLVTQQVQFTDIPLNVFRRFMSNPAG